VFCDIVDNYYSRHIFFKFLTRELNLAADSTQISYLPEIKGMHHPRNQLTGPLRLPFPKRPLKWCWCRAGVGTAHGLPTETARALSFNKGQEGTYCSNQVRQSFMACWLKITGWHGRCRSLLPWIRRLFARTTAMDILN
jgi:hypothetical protein